MFPRLRSRRVPGLSFLAWLLAFTAGVLSAAPPPGYYATAEGKTGEALRAALHLIIRGHTNLPYSTNYFDTGDALKVLDEDPADTNNVFLTYAQRSEGKTNLGLTTGWNREHLWPNSYGLDGVGPAYSDVRNLRAEDANVNSSRGNKYYDTSDTNAASYRLPAHVEAPLCSTDSNSWEPPAPVRGDIARALFYMVVRYRGGVSNEPALYLTDATNQVGTATNLMGRLSTLLRWHEADPVDDRERERDEKIFTRFQGNRNPFVDRPEWVRLAFWPRLELTEHVGTVTLRWPAEFPTATLETAVALPAWTHATAARTNNGTTITATPSAAGPFFRLRLD